MFWTRLAITASLLAVLAGCSSEPDDPRLTFVAISTNGHISFSGQTSLPDGSHLEVWATNAASTGLDDFLSNPVIIAVADGQYSGAIDVSEWHSAYVTASVLFDAWDNQPQAFTSRYGTIGEKMTGPDVRSGDFGYALEIFVTVAQQ